MTTSTDRRPTPKRRRGRLLLVGSLLVLATAGGITAWMNRPSYARVKPPDVPRNEDEPAITSFLEKSRQRVLQEPRSAQVWGALGQAFLANELETESCACFAEAQHLDPANPRWPYLWGLASLKRGQHEAALEALQRAVECHAETDAENLVARLLLAETLLAVGRGKEAEEPLRQALALQPDNPRTHLDLALGDMARKDWSSSRSHLLRCLGSPETRQKASAHLAVVLQRLGDEKEAAGYRQLAAHLPVDAEWNDPYVAEYMRWAVKRAERYRYAERLEGAGRLKEAAAILEPLLEQYPDDYYPRLKLGKVLGQMGVYDRAKALLREARRREPRNAQVLFFLSLVLNSEAEELAQAGGGRSVVEPLYRESAEVARQALELKPDSGFSWMNRGLALKHLDQRVEALTALRKAVQCNPESAELYFRLGEMLVEEKKLREAQERLEQAVQMSPPDAPWMRKCRTLLSAVHADKAPPKNTSTSKP